MTRTPRLLLIWAAAVAVAAVAGLVLLNVMVTDAQVTWSTRIPRRAMTVPMICVIVFWGVARASGVRLEPLRFFTFGGLAVYLALFVVGRLLVSIAIAPGLAVGLMLAAVAWLGWLAIRQADRAGRATRRKRGG